MSFASTGDTSYDVDVRIKLQMVDMKEQMNRINKEMRSVKQNIQKPLSQSGKPLAGGAAQLVKRKSAEELAGLNEQLGTLKDKYAEAGIEAQRWSLRQKTAMRQTARDIVRNALGIMFFGMALQRYSQALWQFGSKAFQEINHSVRDSVTGFDMLQGSLKFLGFMVGQALEPLAMQLFPIVERIAYWVENNEELVRTLVKMAGILGPIFMLTGMLATGIGGVIGMIKGLIGVIARLVGPTAIGSISPAFAKAGASASAALGPLAIIIAVIIALWVTDLGDFKEFVKTLFGDIGFLIKEVFLEVVAIVRYLFLALMALLQGDFETLEDSLEKLLMHLLALITKIVVYASVLITNILIFAFNLVVDLILRTITNLVNGLNIRINNFLIGLLRSARSAFSAIGMGTGLIDRMIGSLEEANKAQESFGDTTDEWADKLKIGYLNLKDSGINDEINSWFGLSDAINEAADGLSDYNSLMNVSGFNQQFAGGGSGPFSIPSFDDEVLSSPAIYSDEPVEQTVYNTYNFGDVNLTDIFSGENQSLIQGIIDEINNTANNSN